MGAGALGAEIIISGKLRTERARAEKFRDGYIPKSGEPAMKYVKRAVTHVQLKPGIFGVQVLIVSPEARFPDEIEIIEKEASQVPLESPKAEDNVNEVES
jgi:small subunit ribosomal protein S3